ncbi:unnamed protein product [Zymoseptoria tritici ST99CH_3D7]|uniref:Uncharacterized protein n=1 Tax=Zymoseptoria tritici (strain ST99CH_3D7) TaxID=1276538 RepID=A0A1X7S424_ZYMT9|nr:unnamed protein product [Zymoseptoria tritici ST99CH_3D7]
MDSLEARTFRRRAPRPRSSSRPRFQDGMERPHSEPVLKRSLPDVHSLRSRSRATSRSGRLSRTAPGSLGKALERLHGNIHLLKWAPVAVIGLLLFLYLTEPLRLPAKRTICKAVLLRDLQFCSPAQHVSNPYFDRLIAQEAKFVDLYHMTGLISSLGSLNPGNFSLVIKAVQIEDTVSAERLEFASKAIILASTSAQRSMVYGLSQTAGLVFNARLTNGRIKNGLLDIPPNNHTFMSPVLTFVTFLGLEAAAGSELPGIFSRSVKRIVEITEKALEQHQQTLGKLGELKDVLGAVAAVWETAPPITVQHALYPWKWFSRTANGGSHLPTQDTEGAKAVRRNVLDQASVWKGLLRSRSTKLTDLDAKAEHCAQYYRDVGLGIRIFETTTLAMQSLLVEFRTLQAVDPSLVNTKETSVELTIAALDASERHLSQVRKW